MKIEQSINTGIPLEFKDNNSMADEIIALIDNLKNEKQYLLDKPMGE